MRWQPALGDFFSLDEETVYTAYLKAKAGRLVLGHHVTHLCHRSTTTTQWFAVRGDHATYTVCLRPLTDPWTAACSRGGVHDATPDGRACSHALAAAVKWVRMSATLRAAAEARQEVAVNG